MGKCVDLLILLVALAMRSAANPGHWAKTPMIQEWKEKVAVSDRTVFKEINQREIDEHEIMEGPGRGRGEKCDYFLREDPVTALGSYDIGTAGCTGDSECQFLTLREAKNFCSSQVDCKTIVEHDDVDGMHCAGGLGCFTPRNGEPEVGGMDTVYEYLCRDCSCNDKTKSWGLKTFGKCEDEEVLDTYGRLVNTGWYLKGPICYVNEPSTCPDIRTHDSAYPEGYSWEACELEHEWMNTWEELWMCEYNKPQGKQTQLSCQALCVDDLECIGISQNLRTHECFLCTDEIMKPLDNDHGEYFRMPPPIHCEWNDWVEGECSAPCGTGERTNVRDKKVVEQYRGACSDVYDFTEMCKIKECPVDCEWNPWVLGECSESCGKGTRIDTRTKNVTEAHGGECETVDTLDTITEDCNLQECPVDCVWGPWVHDAGCILDNGKVCGDGMQTATRDMVIDAYYPGKPCEGDSSKVEACSIECPACSWKQTGGCAWDGTREPHFDKSCDQTILKGHSGYCDCGDEYGTIAMKKACKDGAFDTCDLACAGCTGGDTCCTAINPCGVDQGDCDTTDQCKTGLKCGTDNCSIKTGLDWDAEDDCCYTPDTSKVWHEKTFATAGDTCSTEERLATFSIELAACKEKAEGYGIANYIFWQSATERPAGTPLCHVYKSCEVTRTPSLPGTNYEFVTEGACFDNDLDSYGLDIQSEIEGITSAAACQELCNSNAECNYFTYGNTVLSGKCWLKSAKAIALTSYPGLISGPKTCE